MTDDWALDTLVKKASKPNKKITKASRLICVHSLPIKCLWVEQGFETLFSLRYKHNKTGVYILVRKLNLFPPFFWKLYFPPFFQLLLWPNCVLILLYFVFIFPFYFFFLPFYFPFSFFFQISPLFLFPFSYFFPQMTLYWYWYWYFSPPLGGRGVFSPATRYNTLSITLII